MARQAPNPIDIQDFQFKFYCQLKVFNNEDVTLFNKPCSLLACASQYGLIFVGTDESEFHVIQISSLEKYSETGSYRRTVLLPSCPKHLSVNSDGTKLAVVTEKEGTAVALFYDVKSFTKQDIVIINQLHLSNKPDVNILQVCWNPTASNIFTACKDDGSLGVYELKETTIDINELPVEAEATCMSWSPKGKQLAVGSRNGKITQYKPDLKAMKVINAPPLEGIQHVIAVQWISNYQFIGVFKPPDPDSNASLLVIDSPKTGDTVYTNYEDICYGYGDVREPQFYTIYQPTWNLIMVASSNSIEVGVMGCQGEHWTQWMLSDTARAELPLTSSKQESFPIGVALDIATTEPVVWGETSLPAAPFLLILSHEGLLCCFRVINMRADGQNICQKPATLPDTTGLNQFVPYSPEVKNTAPIVVPTVQTMKPIVAQAASFVKQPLKNESFIQPETKTPSVTFSAPVVTAPVVTAPEESLPLVMSPINNVPSLQLNETNAIEKESDMLIANLIREECETLEAELKSLLHKVSFIKIDLGTDAEAVELVRETDLLQNFLAEVVDTNRAQSTEIYALKQALIQTWTCYEDARFRLAQTRDTTLEALLRLQQLDPLSQRYLSDIKRLSYYLDTQIKQAGDVLDEQWSDFQDKCKKIIRTKVPTMETIYQTMVRHSIVLEKQKYILKDIANRNRAFRSRLSGPSILLSLNSADLFEKSLKRLQLEPEQHFLEAQYEMVLQKHKKFTQNKKDKLISLLNNRDITNVKINKPQLSNVTANLKSFLQSSPRINKPTETSLIGAGLSPITNKSTILWSNTSTPKSTPAVNVSLFHKTPVYETKTIPVEKSATEQSKFNFSPPQPNLTSAFVPTTQLAFNFSNKSTTTTATSSTAFTFGGTSLFKAATSSESSVTATSPKTIGFATPADKGLLSTSSPSTTLPKTTVSTPKTVSSAAFTFKATPVFNFAPSSSISTSSIFSSVTTSGSAFSSTSVTKNMASGTTNSLTVNEGPISVTTSSLGYASNSFAVSTGTSALESHSKLFFNLPVSTEVAIIPAPIGSSITSKISNGVSVSSPIPNFSNLSTKTTSAITGPVVNTTTSTSLFEIQTTSSSPTTSFGTVNASTGSFLNTDTTVSSNTNLFKTATTTNSLFLDKSIGKSILGANTSSMFTVATTGSSIFTSVGDTKSNITSTTGINFGGASASLAGDANSNIFTAVTSTSEPNVSSASDTKLNVGFGSMSNNTLLKQTSIFDSKLQTSSTTTVPSTAVFGTTTSETKFVFDSPLITQSNIFGSTSNTTNNPDIKTISVGFVAKPSTTTSSFSTAGSTGGSLFEPASTASNTGSIFGNTIPTSPTSLSSLGAGVSTSSNSQPVFGTPSTSYSSVPIFGPSFGSATATPATASAFGTAITSSTNLFHTVTTNAGGSIFGSAPTTTTSLFGSPISSPVTTSSIFATQATKPGSIFGSSGTTTQSGSVFGSPITTVAPVFGSSPFTNTASSMFGSAGQTTPFGTSSSASMFGQQATFGGTPIFGSPTSTSTTTFGSNTSVFGSSQASPSANFAPTGFSKPFSFTLPPATTSASSFGFGGLNMGSTNSSFNEQAPNPFSKPFGQEQKSFGGGSIFGTPSTTTSSSIFGTGSPTFGFGSSGGFASPTFGQQTSFGQQNLFGSPSQSGSFSGGNQTVAQSGFGGFSQQTPKPGFGSAPVFGGSPSGFGAAPTFGGSPFNTSFGSPGSSGGFASAPQQHNPTFANLATQNTIGFGALAQQGTQGPSNQTGFSGGSSFSTWR